MRELRHRSDDGRVMYKKYASSDPSGEQVLHLLFETPTDCYVNDKTKHYLEHFHHGLVYEQSAVKYSHMEGMIRKDFENCTQVYVKGCLKKTFLENIVSNVEIIDLLDFGCPKLKCLPTPTQTCSYHAFSTAMCAYQNVISLRSWMMQNMFTYLYKYDKM